MKLCKYIVSIGLFFVAAGGTASPLVSNEVRELLLQGKRKAAILRMRSLRGSDAQKKIILVAEQFITTENFQKYQEMKAYAAAELWSDCLKMIPQVTPADQDNLMVLRTKAHCELSGGQSAESSKTMVEILDMSPNDPEALMGLATLAKSNKKFGEALKLLDPLTKQALSERAGKFDKEKLALLRSEILLESGQLDEAIGQLQIDHDRNLEHIEVIYRLAELFQKKQGNEWLSRRSYALFLSRYKKLASTDQRKTKLEPMYTEAQARLASLDKKLEVKASELGR